jgi:hypothetical protein
MDTGEEKFEGQGRRKYFNIHKWDMTWRHTIYMKIYI